VPLEWQEFALLYGKDEAFTQFYREMRANQVKHQISSFGLLTNSPLWTDFQSTGSELTARSFLQIVRAGSEQEAGDLFDRYVDEWKGAGGADAQTEMSEALTAIYG
jgi:putative aldouronate transport system substrate-binding protein